MENYYCKKCRKQISGNKGSGLCKSCVNKRRKGISHRKGWRLSNETRRNMSIAKKGVKHTEKTKKIMKQKAIERWKNPAEKKRQSELQKIRFKRDGSPIGSMLGKHHTLKSRLQMGRKRQKENNPAWKGGITPERQAFYNSVEWAIVSQKVWKKDRAICQRCKIKKDIDIQFHIHHLVSFQVKELRGSLDNLVLLCEDCHRWVHSRENKKKEFILDKEEYDRFKKL